MKNTILAFAVVFVLVFVLSALSYEQAYAKTPHSPQIHFIVPIKPKSTVITDDAHVYKYLKKGYQIQNAWNNNCMDNNNYVVVKY